MSDCDGGVDAVGMRYWNNGENDTPSSLFVPEMHGTRLNCPF
jgi:hypothetical protein